MRCIGTYFGAIIDPCFDFIWALKNPLSLILNKGAFCVEIYFFIPFSTIPSQIIKPFIYLKPNILFLFLFFQKLQFFKQSFKYPNDWHQAFYEQAQDYGK